MGSTKDSSLKDLQKEIFPLLVQLGVYTDADRDLCAALFDRTSLLKYWKPVFTDPLDSKENIKTYHLKGKAVLRYAFTTYCTQKFGPDLSDEHCEAMVNHYLSEQYLAGFAREYRLANLYKGTISDEDEFLALLFTSFVGALNAVYHDRVVENLGSLICYNLIIHLYGKIDVTYEHLAKSSWCTLKEQMDKDPSLSLRLGTNLMQVFQNDHCVAELNGAFSNKRKAKEELAKKALYALSLNRTLVSREQDIKVRALLPQLRSEQGHQIVDYLVEKKGSYFVQDRKYCSYSLSMIDEKNQRSELSTVTRTSEKEAIDNLVQEFLNRFGHLQVTEISLN